MKSKGKSKCQDHGCNDEHSDVQRNFNFGKGFSQASAKSAGKRKKEKIRFLRKILSRAPRKRDEDDEGRMRYVMYCIVNSSFLQTRGQSAAAVGRGVLGLYNKLDKDRAKQKALDAWESCGELVEVLKGIDHRHLNYLAKELRYAAIECHPVYKTCGRAQVLLVLTTLGREEDLEEMLDGLTHFR